MIVIVKKSFFLSFFKHPRILGITIIEITIVRSSSLTTRLDMFFTFQTEIVIRCGPSLALDILLTWLHPRHISCSLVLMTHSLHRWWFCPSALTGINSIFISTHFKVAVAPSDIYGHRQDTETRKAAWLPNSKQGLGDQTNRNHCVKASCDEKITFFI